MQHDYWSNESIDKMKKYIESQQDFARARDNNLIKNYEYELKYLVDQKFIGQITSMSPAIYKLQGYIPLKENPGYSQIKISKRNDREYGMINLKTVRHGYLRTEYKYPVPKEYAFEMIQKCKFKISKERHEILANEFLWVVDIFKDKNQGLVLAELDFSNELELNCFLENKKDFLPEWVTVDVTEDKRYYNDYLAEHPISTWKTE